MLTIQECQLSIFGNYDYPPTATNVADLMTILSEAAGVALLPNVISVPKIDILANQAALTPSLGFVSENMRLRVALLDERIDVIVSRISDLDLIVEDSLKECGSILCSLMESRCLSSNRLAVNLQYSDSSPDEEMAKAFKKKTVSAFPYYEERVPIEWSMRVNSRVKKTIVNSDEEINVITQINIDQPNPAGKPILLCHLDLNTMPENKVMRFEHNAVTPFLESVAPIARELSNCVEAMVSNA